jgi:putative MFS transporter
LALHGKSEYAQEIVKRATGKVPITGVEIGITGDPQLRKRVLNRGLLYRSIMLWISFPAILLIFYAIMTFMPTILHQEGVPSSWVDRIAALIMAASIPGKWLESWLVEKWGRKPVIVGFSVIAAIAALAFPLAHSISGWIIIGLIFAFFGIAVDPAMKVFAAEQYPTRIRATGVGIAEGWARFLGGALAPYLMALWLENGGIAVSFDFVAAVAVLGALAVAWLGQETKGQVLESVEYRPVPSAARPIQ